VDGYDSDLILVLTQIFQSRTGENAGKLITLAVMKAHTLEPLMETMQSQIHRKCKLCTWNV